MQIGPVGVRRVAVLADGENIAATAAGAALEVAQALGRVTVRRVYRDATQARAWEAAEGFRTVHTGGAGRKNAADMALAIDAVELALRGQAEAFVLLTSDADFTGLACWLRENGFPVDGVGEAKSAAAFRAACDTFRVVPSSTAAGTARPPPSNTAAPRSAAPPPAAPAIPDKVTALLAQVDEALGQAQKDGWMRLAVFGQAMTHKGVPLASTSHGSWRAFLRNFPNRYELEAPSPTCRVRLRQRPGAKA